MSATQKWAGRLLTGAFMLGLAAVGVCAEGTANTAVTAKIDDAKATFDAILPIALTVLGTFIAVNTGKKVWRAMSK